MMCAKYSTYVYWGTGIVLVLSPRGNFDKRDIILVGIIESKRLSYTWRWTGPFQESWPKGLLGTWGLFSEATWPHKGHHWKGGWRRCGAASKACFLFLPHATI